MELTKEQLKNMVEHYQGLYDDLRQSQQITTDVEKQLLMEIQMLQSRLYRLHVHIATSILAEADDIKDEVVATYKRRLKVYKDCIKLAYEGKYGVEGVCDKAKENKTYNGYLLASIKRSLSSRFNKIFRALLREGLVPNRANICNIYRDGGSNDETI
jgi:hypothetical protein